MTSIKVKFRPSTVDGKEGGLYFQIIHNRVVRQQNTDYKVFAEEWDAETENVIVNGNRSNLLLGIQERLAWDVARLEKVVRSLETERRRFTAAHELAHLLLTFPASAELDVEKRCNKFAGFFLFTKQALIEEMGSEKRDELMLEEMIDLREVYGISIAAQVHAAWDIRMISREHYDWWFDEKIKKNRLEVGWGEYIFPETIGRERRMDVRTRKWQK